MTIINKISGCLAGVSLGLFCELFVDAEQFVPDPVAPFGDGEVGFDYFGVVLFHVYFQDAVNAVLVFFDLDALNCLHSRTGTSR